MAFKKEYDAPAEQQSLQNLTFKIARIKFVNESGFYVAEGIHKSSIASLSGVCKGIEKSWEGREITVSGEWVEDPKWGRQFKAKTTTAIMPKSASSLEVFFANKVDGIGAATVRKLSEHFGENFLEVLENHPNRLMEVLTEERAEDLANYWKKEKNMFDMKTKLSSHGLSENQISKIYDKYKQNALNAIKKDPYSIMLIDGIGFKVADKMAMSMGFAKDNPFRIRAALFDFVQQAVAEKGSTILEKTQTMLDLKKSLNVSDELIQKCYSNLTGASSLIERTILGKVYISIGKTAIEEKEIADKVKALMENKSYGNVRVKIHNTMLDQSQISAVNGAFNDGFSIITGGPGTGKTTIIKEILTNAQNNSLSVCMLAPTGKAAKRMEEATGYNSSTLHRKLGISGGNEGFAFNNKKPLPYDMVIVDEYSMMDTNMTAILLKAVRSGTRVLFVGDANQLPSVGAGEVFRDLLDSGFIPVHSLKFTHRQSKGSAIAEVANDIVNDLAPPLTDDFASDCVFVEQPDVNAVYVQMAQIIKHLIEEGVNRDDIQILSPQKSTLVGVDELNDGYKDLFNPNWESPLPAEWKNLNIRFRVGDRVMQTRNNYDLDIFNGDIGYVKEVYPNRLKIEFDDKLVEIKNDQMSDVKLSYAFTVHKSQGSEAKYVIMPIVPAHTFMLNRNIIYTGITRAKQKMIMVGSKDTFYKAIKQQKRHERETGLNFELQASFGAQKKPIQKIKDFSV